MEQYFSNKLAELGVALSFNCRLELVEACKVETGCSFGLK
jgi:hypothetical protein